MTQSKWWHQPSLEMRKQGKSSRQIAKDLFGKSSMKSSVNYFFNKWDAENIDKDNTKLKIKDNVLFYDIETSLSVSYHWNQWGVDLSNKQKIHESHLLSHAWAWGNGDVEGTVLSPEEAINRDPERLVLEAWALLDNCDVLVGHNCMEETSKILTKNLDWVEVKDLEVGDELIGFDEGKSPFLPNRDSDGKWLGQGKNRNIKPCVVTEHTTVEKEAFEVTFTDGSKVVTTDDHYWLGKTQRKGNLTWIKTKDLIKRNAHIVKYMDVWDRDLSYESGWLSGFIDGEGSLVYSSNDSLSGMQICQRPTSAWSKCLNYLNKYGVSFSEPKKKIGGLGRGDCEYIYTSGKWGTLELVGKLDIVKFKETMFREDRNLGTLTACGRPTLRVVSVKPVGKKNIVILGTSTSTYFSEGFAMHNCKKYDVRKVNAYFLQYGLPPPSPYKVVDTLRIAKSKFALPFNSLDYLAKFLGVEQKIETSGIDLWIKCSQGDNEALRTMLEYNLGDVKTQRAVYEKLIAWDNQAANMAVYNDDSDALCPHCGSDDIKSLEGKFAHTMNRKYHLFRCSNCSATLRGNTSESKVNKFVRVV